MQALSHDHSLYDVSHVPSQKECHHCAPSNGVLDEQGGGSHDHSGQCSNDQSRDSLFLHCHGRDPSDHVLRISSKCHLIKAYCYEVTLFSIKNIISWQVQLFKRFFY